MGIGWILITLINFQVTTAQVGMDVHALFIRSWDTIIAGGRRGAICSIKNFLEKDSIEKKCVSVGDFLITSLDFNGEKGVAVGERGRIYVTSDGGTSWTDVTSGNVNYHLLDVEWLNEKLVVAVGDWGTVLVSRDGGRTWEERSLRKLFDPASWSIPVLAEDVEDRERRKVYRKGEEIPREVASRLMKKGVKVWIRYDIILNDAKALSSSKVAIVGERGKIFVMDLSSDKVQESNVISTAEDEEGLFGEEAPTLFFIAGSPGLWVTGGGEGRIFINRSDSLTGPWEEVTFPWRQEDTVFSGDVREDTICLGGAYGTVIFSFDGGKTWERFTDERFAVKWFRRARVVKKGACLFAGEDGNVILVSE